MDDLYRSLKIINYARRAPAARVTNGGNYESYSTENLAEQFNHRVDRSRYQFDRHRHSKEIYLMAYDLNCWMGHQQRLVALFRVEKLAEKETTGNASSN